MRSVGFGTRDWRRDRDLGLLALVSFLAACSGNVSGGLTDLGARDGAMGDLVNVPTPEVCGNGLDEDLDGAPDDGCECALTDPPQACYAGPPSEAGRGICNMGLQACERVPTAEFSFNQRGACLGAGAPASEVCNGSDDDCDGVIDDGADEPCSNACGSGVRRCVHGILQVCSAPGGVAETCNGADDDCDGYVDDGGVCGSCGDGLCDGTAPALEFCDNCEADCGPCGTATCIPGTYAYHGVCCVIGTGVTCNGIPHCLTMCPGCGNGVCETAIGERCYWCPQDCGQCCDNDGVCEPDDPRYESCSNCENDCGACPPPSCPNGTCEQDKGEWCYWCPQDCGACCDNDGVCENAWPQQETCDNCANDCGACPPPSCPNGTCEQDKGEWCYWCPQDCGACCDNDGVCDNAWPQQETCSNCPTDCGPCCVAGTSLCNGVCCPNGQCRTCNGLPTCAQSC